MDSRPEWSRRYDEQVEAISRACHEVNRAWCLAHGDKSQKPWEEAPDWHRLSVWNGVNFHLNNLHSTPEDSHINWMREKAADGWVYGEVKNVEEKTHPCMKPYEELPRAQRLKDTLFVATVRTMAAAFRDAESGKADADPYTRTGQKSRG